MLFYSYLDNLSHTILNMYHDNYLHMIPGNHPYNFPCTYSNKNYNKLHYIR